MQINIITMARKRTNYLAKTLKDLFDSEWKDHKFPVNLILGSNEESHIPVLLRDKVSIVPWDKTTTDNKRRNSVLTHVNALRHGDGPTIILEDDVGLKPDWLSAIMRLYEAIPYQDYALCLNQGRFKGKCFDVEYKGELLGYCLRAFWAKNGKAYECKFADNGERDYPALIGTQGMFYSNKAVRDGIADYMEENQTKGCSDYLQGRVIHAKYKMFLTNRILVWHTGQISCFC